MKKQEKISQIAETCRNPLVRATLIQAGIKESQIDLVQKRCERETTKATFIDGVHKVLPEIMRVTDDYHEVMKLVDAGTWEYYLYMDFDNLETKERKKVLKDVKKVWHTLPKYKKADHEKKN